MSYSFSVQAANKADAKAAVKNKFAEIVRAQPIHERDGLAVLANAYCAIEALHDDDTRDVAVSCNGYLSWSGSVEEPEVIAASIAAQASYVLRK